MTKNFWSECKSIIFPHCALVICYRNVDFTKIIRQINHNSSKKPTYRKRLSDFTKFCLSYLSLPIVLLLLNCFHEIFPQISFKYNSYQFWYLITLRMASKDLATFVLIDDCSSFRGYLSFDLSLIYVLDFGKVSGNYPYRLSRAPFFCLKTSQIRSH